MKRRTQWLLGSLVAAGLGVGSWMAFGGPNDERARERLALVPRVQTDDALADEQFGLTRVHRVHITLSADEYAAVQPIGERRPHGPPGPPPRSEPVVLRDGREAATSNFGTTFPWAHADVEIGDRTFRNVGLRYKGNASYDASRHGLQRSLKVDLQQFDRNNGKFHGEKKLNLHASVMDATKTREAMAYAVFRTSGVPAPRTAFADVELTIPGKYDRERMGVYVLVEQVDKGFLRSHFGSGEGMLLKPERVRSFDYLGESWDAYESRYAPEDPPTAEQKRRLIDFARLVQRGSDDEFNATVESYLDVDAFCRFVAVSGLIADLDGFLASGHNFYVYLNPKSNQFDFIPWDMDLSFGAFPMAGGSMQQVNLSVEHPWGEGNKLAERIFAIPQHRKRYREILDELLADKFTQGVLVAFVEEIETVVKPRLELDATAATNRGEGGLSLFGSPRGIGLPLRSFIVERFESIEAQRRGRRPGYVPTLHTPGGRRSHARE